MTKIKTILLLAVLALLSQNLCAQYVPQDFPKRETRAVWLATIGGIDWPRKKVQRSSDVAAQQAELCTLLDRLAAANINMVLLQTRIRGSVIYPSSLEPWDNCLTGKANEGPGYDPLKFAVEECHKRGMECHAWVVVTPLGELSRQKKHGRQGLLQRHPELVKTVKGECFMRPDQPGTAEHVADVCAEIARNYDIDGISLDYIRYPEKQYGYSDNASPSQKRENITRIVRTVHDRVKVLKPWVRLSSSPIGKYDDLPGQSSRGWNCYTAVYQDPQAWLRDGIQDAIYPMMYFRNNDFYPFLLNWSQNRYGRDFSPGLGIYFLDPREGKWQLDDVRRELYVSRQLEAGFVLYRAHYLVQNFKGIYQTIQQELCPFKALPSALAAAEGTAPAAPENLSSDGSGLWWSSGNDYGADITYNIYGGADWPVDTSRPENLLQVAHRGTSLALNAQTAGRRYYAVCAMDRYGRESEPCQMEQRPSPPKQLIKDYDDQKTKKSAKKSSKKSKKNKRKK